MCNMNTDIITNHTCFTFIMILLEWHCIDLSMVVFLYVLLKNHEKNNIGYSTRGTISSTRFDV